MGGLKTGRAQQGPKTAVASTVKCLVRSQNVCAACTALGSGSVQRYTCCNKWVGLEGSLL